MEDSGHQARVAVLSMAQCTAVANLLGRRAAVVYCTTIAVVSLLFGWLLDLVYQHLAIAPTAAAGRFHDHVGWPSWVCAVLVALLVAGHLVRKVRGTRPA